MTVKPESRPLLIAITAAWNISGRASLIKALLAWKITANSINYIIHKAAYQQYKLNSLRHR